MSRRLELGLFFFLSLMICASSVVCTRSKPSSEHRDLSLVATTPSHLSRITPQTLTPHSICTPTPTWVPTRASQGEVETDVHRTASGRVISVARTSNSSNYSLGLLDMETGTIRVLDWIDPSCITRFHCDIKLAPNESLLAYYDDEGFLTLLHIEAGEAEAEQLVDGGSEGDRFITWSPDSQQLAFVKNGDLFRLSLASKHDEVLLTRHESREYHQLSGGSPIVRSLQIRNPVWLSNSKLVFTDFAAPGLILGGAEEELQSTYYLSPEGDSTIRSQLFPGKILLSSAANGTAFLVRDARNDLADDEVFVLAPNDGLTSVFAISRGSNRTWSRDGTRVAQSIDYIDGDVLLTALEAITLEEPIAVLRLWFPGPITSAIWSSSGQRILFVSDGMIQVIDIASGIPSHLFRIQEAYDVRLVAWLDES